MTGAFEDLKQPDKSGFDGEKDGEFFGIHMESQGGIRMET